MFRKKYVHNKKDEKIKNFNTKLESMKNNQMFILKIKYLKSRIQRMGLKEQ